MPTRVARRLDELAKQIRVCTRCPLHAARIQAVPGDGKPSARVLFIGEAPGRDEDRSGHPFVGAAGRFLDHILEGTGIRREDLFITNVVKCRPPKNRTPHKKEVDTCTAHYLDKQIELLDPALIVLLGAVAVKKVLGVANVGSVRGRLLEQDGRKYFVTYHPAVRFYREDLARQIEEDFAVLRQELQTL